MSRYFLIFSLFSITASLQALAQKMPTSDAMNRRQINRDDTLFQFFAFPPPSGLKIIKTYYYWYSKDTIMVTTNGFDGRLLNGKYKVFYPNGNLKENGLFSMGLKIGKWKEWYPNGQLKSIVQWKNSRKNGRFREFNEKGSLILESKYKRNYLHGTHIVFAGDSIIAKTKYNKGNEIPGKASKAAQEKSITENALP